MHVTVDHDKCIASGACVLACHEVFAQDEDGIVVLLQENPPEELRDRVMAAVRGCPATVIDITGA
jgi:ferredoxin